MGKIDKSRRGHLALNIARLRKGLGINQETLAARVGVHTNTIKDLERGASEGRSETRKAIAEVLGATEAQLFSDPELDHTPEMHPSALAREIADEIDRRRRGSSADLTAQEMDLLAAFRSLPSKRKDVAVRLVKDFGDLDVDALLATTAPARKTR